MHWTGVGALSTHWGFLTSIPASPSDMLQPPSPGLWIKSSLCALWNFYLAFPHWWLSCLKYISWKIYSVIWIPMNPPNVFGSHIMPLRAYCFFYLFKMPLQFSIHRFKIVWNVQLSTACTCEYDLYSARMGMGGAHMSSHCFLINNSVCLCVCLCERLVPVLVFIFKKKWTCWCWNYSVWKQCHRNDINTIERWAQKKTWLHGWPKASMDELNAGQTMNYAWMCTLFFRMPWFLVGFQISPYSLSVASCI